jgi:hypothetical protein
MSKKHGSGNPSWKWPKTSFIELLFFCSTCHSIYSNPFSLPPTVSSPYQFIHNVITYFWLAQRAKSRLWFKSMLNMARVTWKCTKGFLWNEHEFCFEHRGKNSWAYKVTTPSFLSWQCMLTMSGWPSFIVKSNFILIFLRRKGPGQTGARTRDLRQHRLALNTNALTLYNSSILWYVMCVVMHVHKIIKVLWNPLTSASILPKCLAYDTSHRPSRMFGKNESWVWWLTIPWMAQGRCKIWSNLFKDIQ